jgi:type IV pilus assembly protein PilM
MDFKQIMTFTAKKKIDHVVGVDLDSDSIAAAVTEADGSVRAAVEPLPEGAVSGGEIVESEQVAEALSALFSRAKLDKHVRLAVASQGVAFRTLRLPLIENPDQLKNAVRFQAQEQIPMPLDSAVLDHQVIGAHVGEDGGRQIDVAVVAARRQSIETLLRSARRAGLDPVGIDLAAFGMIRALAGGTAMPAAAFAPGADPQAEEYRPATLYCGLGGVTNLAIARDFTCLFSRVAQFSVRGIAEELAQSTGLSLDHSQQWLVHVGLETPTDAIEGDPGTVAATRSVLEANVGRLADELRLSVDYYSSQEDGASVADVVVCGWGSAIPGLPNALGAVLGYEVKAARPPALAGFGDGEAARLTLPYGLALER